MKILLVDDDKVMLFTLSKLLGSKGHEVIIANNAYEALSYIQFKEVDLIISDIMIPDMSGIELINVLKRFYCCKVPLIFISSISRRDIIKIFGDVYGRHYLPKPLNHFKLYSKINSLFSKRKKQYSFSLHV